MISGSSARNRNGGAIRSPACACSSSGQHSIISPVTDATPSTSARARGEPDGAPALPLTGQPRTSATVQPRRPEHLGHLRREGRRLRRRPRAPGRATPARPRPSPAGRRPPARRTRRRGWRPAPPSPSAASSRRIAASACLAGVVEAAGRLVEQQQAGPVDQHQRQGERQPLALGEVARVRVVRRRRARAGRAARGSRPVPPSPARALLGDGLQVEQVGGGLRHQAGQLAAAGRSSRGRVDAAPRPAVRRTARGPGAPTAGSTCRHPLRPIRAVTVPPAQVEVDARGRRRCRRGAPVRPSAGQPGRPARAPARAPAAAAGVERAGRAPRLADRQRQRRPAGEPAQLDERGYDGRVGQDGRRVADADPAVAGQQADPVGERDAPARAGARRPAR